MRSTHSSRYKLLLRRLQAARLEAGLTQAEVARAVARPQSFVSKCESGERRVDAVELLELARLYGKPVGYFVAEGEGTGGASVSSERTAASDRAAVGSRPGSRRRRSARSRTPSRR